MKKNKKIMTCSINSNESKEQQVKKLAKFLAELMSKDNQTSIENERRTRTI